MMIVILALLVGLLIGNLFIQTSSVFFVQMALAATGLLFQKWRGRPVRMGFLVFSLTALLSLWLVGIWVNGAQTPTLKLAILRSVSGLGWIFLSSSILVWTRIKRELAPLKFLSPWLEYVDFVVGHAEIFVQEIEKRILAAWLRVGNTDKSIPVYAGALVSGIENTFDKMIQVEDAKLLRAGLPAYASSGAANLSEPMAADDYLIDIKKAAWIYPKSKQGLFVNDVEVAAGEWVAVLGASGSGKSTLLKALSGLLPLTSGKFKRFGVDVQGSLQERVDPRVAMMFQDPNEQILGSTPLSDAIWALQKRGLSLDEAEQKTLALYKEMDLLDLADRPISKLSFGEKKKVCLASLIVTEPHLLLCDELTCGLDPRSAIKLLRFLTKITQQLKMTVLWATHEEHLLPEKIQRVLLLSEGHLIFDGPRDLGLSQERLEQASLR